MEQFDNKEIFDDFKPADEQGTFVSDAIGNVIERELTEVELFKEKFDEPFLVAEHPKDNLMETVVTYIQSCGDVNQVYFCSYTPNKGAALDGWAFNVDDELTTLDLFLTEYVSPETGYKITSSELERDFNWLRRFYEQSMSGKILGEFMNDTKSDLYQVADLIHSSNKIDRIRLFVLTNAIAPNDFVKDNLELSDGSMCEYNVWDIRRIMQQNNILSGRNQIVVDFERDYNYLSSG